MPVISIFFFEVYSVSFLDDLLSAFHFSESAGKLHLKESLGYILVWD